MTVPVGVPQATDYGFSSARNGIALPAGLQESDIIFFCLVSPNPHVLNALPSGLFQLGATQTAAEDDSSLSVLFAIATGEEASSFDLGEIYASPESGGVLAFALRGLSATNLIDVVAQSNQTIEVGGGTVVGPTVTPSGDGKTVLQIIATDPSTDPISVGPDDIGIEIYSGKIDSGNFGFVFAQFHEQNEAGALALESIVDYGPLNFMMVQASLNPGGPSIDTAEDIVDETQPATVTLVGNSSAPSAIRINGSSGTNITSEGSGVYSYLPPLIEDDPEAELEVVVGGETLASTISYANSYDRGQLSHGDPDGNSLNFGNQYATSLAYEWKVIADANPAIVSIDWDELEAADGLNDDLNDYATTLANGSTTVTLGVFIPESGQSVQFSRTIVVSDGSVVVEGDGLFRELFKDPINEIFTDLFR